MINFDRIRQIIRDGIFPLIQITFHAFTEELPDGQGVFVIEVTTDSQAHRLRRPNEPVAQVPGSALEPDSR
jgi:hypothetical protein